MMAPPLACSRPAAALANTPNKSLQQTGAAVRLFRVFCLLRGPGC